MSQGTISCCLALLHPTTCTSPLQLHLPGPGWHRTPSQRVYPALPVPVRVKGKGLVSKRIKHLTMPREAGKTWRDYPMGSEPGSLAVRLFRATWGQLCPISPTLSLLLPPQPMYSFQGS